MIKLNYNFKDARLLQEALTHKSFHYENKEKGNFNNERLEFLGDAVLDLVISQKIMELFPRLSEGDLTKIRANLVNEQSLFDIAEDIGIKDQIKVGKGEIKNWDRGQRRITGSAVEAIIGAIFSDSNYGEAKHCVLALFKNKLESINLDDLDEQDFKSKLQEHIQRDKSQTPIYEVVEEFGDDHDKTFKMRVKIAGRVLAEASGASKKLASQNAAKKALEEL
ncbi:ribonuclease III [bacterium]|nr:ribonuclease III [bacterium]